MNDGASYQSPRAPWAKLALFLVAFIAVCIAYRLYQQNTAFTVGLDYFSPEFQTYWMNLMYFELVALTVIGASIAGWLWRTRDRNVQTVAPGEELRRYLVLLSMVMGFGVILVFVGSNAAESDAAWHQVTVRDTDFTPTHIMLFYFGIPVFIIGVLTPFLYARTRLPQFARRFSLPFALLVAGPVMIMPNVGFNEWGHTFFYAEELFAAPIHYGFIFLGWSAFATGGLVVQLLTRIVELTKVVGQPEGLAFPESDPRHAAAAAQPAVA